MDLKTFGKRAVTTSSYFGAGTGNRFELYYLVTGLAGEAGEVCNIMRKTLELTNQSMRPNDMEIIKKNLPKISNELGDVMWFLVKTMIALGLDPEQVMGECDAKLAQRYPEEYARLPTYEVVYGDVQRPHTQEEDRT